MLNCYRESYMVTSAAENGARRRPRPHPPIPPMNEDGHVLKSRRGLLAAGLAVAVVGAIGVASTLNAGAEQVPGDQAQAQAPVAEQDDATDDVSTPPATLPWGGKPQRAHRGRVGASSNELRAQGLQAAADDSGHHLDFAPKGRATRNGFVKTQDTDIKPPAPAPSASASTTAPTTAPTTSPATSPATTAPTTTAPAAQTTTTSASQTAVQPLAATSAAAAAAATSSAPVSTGGKDGSATFLYSTGSEATTADGMYAAIDIKKPTLAKGDFHTLAEIAVQSADTNQTIEVGWTIDRSVNGDEDPHIFVYHWVNGVPTCYNVCGGFVPYKGGVAPGDTLPADTLKKFGIQHNDGAWWIAYDTTFVGYFPDKEWASQGVNFTQGGYFQAWGEVAASSSCPVGTQMGSGVQSTDTASAARIGNVTYINGPQTPNLFMRASTSLYGMSPFKDASDPTGVRLSTKSFRFGGGSPYIQKDKDGNVVTDKNGNPVCAPGS
jgi:hypothetical protein